MKYLLFLFFFIKFILSQHNDVNSDNYYDDYHDDYNNDNDDYDDDYNLLNLKYYSTIDERKLVVCDSSVTNRLVDWSNVYTSQVKNAGLCLNAGWAFAAADQVESDTLRIHGIIYKYVLSTQQLIDCVSFNNGCISGKIEQAYDYLLSNGLEQSNNYPHSSYFSINQRCSQDSSLSVVKLGGYYNLLKGNEACMANYVQKIGPITVCVSASLSWYSYSGGVMTLSSCPATNYINHCLQVVGVYPNVNGGYWKLKNSYGTGWGEKGYIRLAYGSNVCNIINNPIYTFPIVDF